MPIISKTIPNLVGMQMYYKPPEVVDPEATPIYQNWNSSIIIDEVGNRTQYDASTNPDNVLLYSWNMEYQEAVDPPFEFEYFYVKNEDTVDINITMSKANGVNVDSYYRILPNTEWVVWPGTVTLAPNQKCEIKRDSILQFGKFSSTGLHSVGGNIMTLLYGDLTEEKTVISTQSQFFMMFDSDSNLISASNLLLPATTLANSCYQQMFAGCTSLTEAPELPATELVRGCYSYMFYNCSSLTAEPELPATTLASGCYNCMFQGCTSLTEAPELPATILAEGCYSQMFRDCTSLNYIKAMFVNEPVSMSWMVQPLDNWVYNVASTGTFVMNSEATWNPEDYRGNSGIPNNWTVQTASS